MPISDISCQLDDGLHPLHLTLDVLIEVLLFDLRKKQEVDGSRILVRI
jgi:hypothetical protein